MAEADRLIDLAKRTIGPRELDRAFDTITGDVDAFTDQTFKERADAQEAFAETVPTTMAGLLTMVIYAHEIKKRDPEAFCLYDEPLLSTLATAARLLRMQSKR